MKITGSCRLYAPAQHVWPMIFDPSSLMKLIPGCQQVEQLSPDEYQAQIRIGIAAVSGTYCSHVKVLEQQAPEHCRMRGEVTGPTGTISGEASFNLEEVDQQTILTYEGNAVITGALAKMSARFFEGVVSTLINQGLGKLNRQLEAGLPTNADSA